MELAELSHLVSLSMSYQAYAQELNARNVRMAGSGQKLQLDSTFAELLQQVNVSNTSSVEWRSLLLEKTTSTADAMSLDEISIAVEKSAGQYKAVSEAYSRVLSLYRTGLGRG